MNQSHTWKSLIILLFISLSIFSQGNWKKGFIVKKNNDTINGHIEFKTINKCFEKINFNNNGVITTYFPKQINSFSINIDKQNLHFNSAIVKIELSDNSLSKLTNNPAPNLVLDNIFVQLIVQGTKNLYYYEDMKVGNKHFLIDDNNGNITDLIFKKYYLDVAQTKIGYNEQYKGQLINHLTNCKQINFESINVIKFKIDVLIKLFTDYNNCFVNQHNSYEYKVEKSKVQFGLIFGCNLSSLQFKSETDKISQSILNNSLGINFGLYMNVPLTKTNNKWAFYNELLYSSYKYTGTGYNIYYNDPSWYKKITDVGISATYLKLFTALRYQTQRYKLKPFFQLGIVNGYAIQSASYSNIESRFFSTTSNETKPMVDFRKYEQSLFLGLGVNYKKVGFEFRYELGNGMSEISSVHSRTNYLYFLLNYRF